jgi:hypothetical protein
LASTLLLSGQALAQQANPLLNREGLLPAAVMWLQMQGSKLTYLGEEGGVKGYLAEAPNGMTQSVYITPDGNHLITGVLFEKGGKNVTGVQIGEMQKRFNEAAKSASTAANAAADAMGVGVGETAAPAAPVSNSPEPKAEPSKPAEKAAADDDAEHVPSVVETAPAVGEQGSKIDLHDDSAVAIPASAPSSDGGLAPAAAMAVDLPAADKPVAGAEGNPSDVWVSTIDKQEFLAAAEAAPYFEVGSQTAPVTLWEIGDPQCPYCHATWDYVKPLIYAKKVKVRVILIAGLEGSEPLAREVLSSASPARTWLASDAGRKIEAKTDPNSKEWIDSLDYLNKNMKFARQFKINRTPFLAYVAPDGRFYSVLGLPSDLGSFLSASGINSK